MKKIINRPGDVVEQLLRGVEKTYGDLLERVPRTGIMMSKKRVPGRVAVISGGGTGHEPAHSGYVGENFLTASINGPVFEAPAPQDILQAIELADQGAGVFIIIKNFDSDVTNFLLATEFARERGSRVKYVIVNDDCSVEKGNFKKRRRGVAGTVFVHKIVSAAAALGADLASLEELANDVVRATNTLGVALESGVLPGAKKPQFQLAESEISFGIGIHGEAGYREEPLESSEKLANELINKLKTNYSFTSQTKLAILVNGLGSTPLMELFIFTNDVRRLLALENVEVCFQKVGNFMTSTDMAGVSLTFLEIKDPKWLDYLEVPARAYGW